MLGRRVPSLLPRMTREEQLGVSAILSSAGLLPERGAATLRPFRAPHHTVSAAGLVGGGEPIRPGEVTLAHHGVLFLDEVTEFRSEPLEMALRALREGETTIGRRGVLATFPARALLVAAANACLCGYAGTPRCTCTAEQHARHQARIDRVAPAVDMTITLQPESTDAPRGESSAEIRARVVAAREWQAERAERLGIAPLNAALAPRALEIVAQPDGDGARAIAAAVEQGSLSTAAYGKVLRVARTIADLDGSETVCCSHVVEALSYVRAGARGADSPTTAPPEATPAPAGATSVPTAAPTSPPGPPRRRAATAQSAAGGTDQLSPAKKAWITRRAKQAAAAAGTGGAATA
jgi:magnesium chelatase family protein